MATRPSVIFADDFIDQAISSGDLDKSGDETAARQFLESFELRNQ